MPDAFEACRTVFLWCTGKKAKCSCDVEFPASVQVRSSPSSFSRAVVDTDYPVCRLILFRSQMQPKATSYRPPEAWPKGLFAKKQRALENTIRHEPALVKLYDTVTTRAISPREFSTDIEYLWRNAVPRTTSALPFPPTTNSVARKSSHRQSIRDDRQSMCNELLV